MLIIQCATIWVYMYDRLIHIYKLPASFMKVYTTILLMLISTIALAQTNVVGRFVDKLYGTKYLIFKADSTFTFEIGICLQHDIACGTYKKLNDTIYLAYKYDMTDICCNTDQVNVKAKTAEGKYELLIEPETGWRPDTLFIQNNNLYEIKNNKVVKKTIRFQIKPNGSKPQGARRKYFLFGDYVYNERPTFYMEKISN